MANLKERTDAMLAKVSDLKNTRIAADTLVAELEKEKDKLPASVKSALTAYGKKKKP